MHKSTVMKYAKRSITEMFAQAIAHQNATTPIAKNIAKVKGEEARARFNELNKVTKDYKSGIKIAN